MEQHRKLLPALTVMVSTEATVVEMVRFVPTNMFRNDATLFEGISVLSLNILNNLIFLFYSINRSFINN